MNENGILQWSFTRLYDIGDGPWPSEDEAEIEYESRHGRVTISGVYFDGNTAWEGCVRRVRYRHQEDELHVDVGTVPTGETLANDVIQRIHYEVTVEFAAGLPARTRLRHLIGEDATQFATTARRGET